MFLIGAVRWLVPREARARWLGEWRAELWHQASLGRLSPLRCLAAIPHAATIRWQHWRPDTVSQDLRYAFRQIALRPGFSLVVVLTLALGIGANSLVYSVLDSTVLNPLSFPDADRIVYVWRKHPAQNLRASPTVELVRQWREHVEGFESIQIVSHKMFTLLGGDDAVRLHASRVSPDFFDLAGAAPLLGRIFDHEEAVEGRHRVAVLSYGLWSERFAGREDAIGEALDLDGERYTVIGIMPRDFRMQAPFSMASLWVPLIEDDVRGGMVMARLAPGATVVSVDAEMDALAAPTEQDGEPGWSGQAASPQEMLSGGYRNAVWAFQGAVALVLLIAAVNVANLMLARASGRLREMAIRTALGGARTRLVRQLLIEAMLLAGAGGAVGFGSAWLGVRAIVAFRPEALRSLETLRLDPVVFVLTTAVTVIVGLGVGLVPSLQSTARGLTTGLTDGGRAGTQGPGKRRLRDGLVVLEVALCAMLLVGAALLVRSFLRLQAVDPGFDSDGVLTLRVSLPETRYPETAEQGEFWQGLERNMRTALGPRLEDTTYAIGFPPDSGINFGALEAEGVGAAADVEGGEQSQVAAVYWVSPSYFRTMRIPLLAGRTFASDRRDSGEPVVVNEHFARATWGSPRDAVGKRFRYVGAETWQTVIGVAGDVESFGPLSEVGDDQFYYPLRFGDHVAELGEGSLMMGLRAADGDPLALSDAARRVIADMDAKVPVEELSSLGERFGETIAQPRFNAQLMVIFAAIAIGLALIGVYGVLTYSVASRTREIGVRMALGADGRNVMGAVAVHGLALILLGASLGGAGSVAFARLVESLLFEVPTMDPFAYAATIAMLLLVGLGASAIPALRATRVDPVEALRAE